jgi:hypothetical protein
MTSNRSRSKKRSGANSISPPLESVVFFVDRDLGKKKFPRLLREAGVEVRIHDDFFPQDEDDEVWLAAVGRRQWFVISNDERIRYREPARLAIEEAKVGVFIFASPGHLKAEEKAKIFIDALPKIRRFIETHTPPFIAKIRRDDVLLW